MFIHLFNPLWLNRAQWSRYYSYHPPYLILKVVAKISTKVLANIVPQFTDEEIGLEFKVTSPTSQNNWGLRTKSLTSAVWSQDSCSLPLHWISLSAVSFLFHSFSILLLEKCFSSYTIHSQVMSPFCYIWWYNKQ